MKYPTVQNAKHIGFLPGGAALASADLGEAIFEGQKVTITWGRNLSERDADHYAERTHYKPINTNPSNGVYELIIPEDHAAKLRAILIRPAGYAWQIAQGSDARNLPWFVERIDTDHGRIYLFTNDTFTRAFLGDEPDSLTDEDFDEYDPATSEISITESTEGDLKRIGLTK